MIAPKNVLTRKRIVRLHGRSYLARRASMARSPVLLGSCRAGAKFAACMSCLFFVNRLHFFALFLVYMRLFHSASFNLQRFITLPSFIDRCACIPLWCACEETSLIIGSRATFQRRYKGWTPWKPCTSACSFPGVWLPCCVK